MKATAQSAQKVELVEVATGRVLMAWPVDARELCAQGEFRRTDVDVIALADVPDVVAEDAPTEDAPSDDPSSGDPPKKKGK